MTLTQNPTPGSFLIHRCGDVFQLKLTVENKSLQPYLRTSLGGSKKQRRAHILKTEQDLITSRNNWHDLPLTKVDELNYEITLPLYEVGLFEAKVWLSHTKTKKVIWAPGENTLIKTEPASTIVNNSIYGVFTRQFGPNKHKDFALEDEAEAIKDLDSKGYHVIPPSGTFRDVAKELDHIMEDMGFRILQLLPIHPTPTTFARMGRFGSPYAALDFFSVDPALAEFDKHATPLDQFIELVDEVHRRDGEIFLDIPVDHTGWASTLQKDHPEYFIRNAEGQFMSPSAWGTIWEDLVKLDFDNTDVHQMMADVFLYWCKKGVDGFRCDAGYMVPFVAWQYIIAKVRHEYPHTIFLLEGLGGPAEVTEHLLSKATFSWAYSELFQNYSKDEVSNYVNNMLRINSHKGGLTNFSETHDNIRMAATSPTWSMMRNMLCALTAQAGAFGISNGVEFFAQERISVHHARGLNWGNGDNQINLLKQLTTIFKVHPAFQADAHIEVVHQNTPEVFMCKRIAANGDTLLIIVNLNCESEKTVEGTPYLKSDKGYTDLLSGASLDPTFTLSPGAALCIDNSGLYASRINSFNPANDDTTYQLQLTKETLLKTHAHFNGFGKITSNYVPENIEALRTNPLEFCLKEGASLGQIVQWDVTSDAKRIVMATSKSILLIESKNKFDFFLSTSSKNIQSGKALQKSDDTYFALVPLHKNKSNEIEYLDIKVNSKSSNNTEHKKGKIALLPKGKADTFRQAFSTKEVREKQLYALCTNTSGSMSQVSGLWGEYKSKYDSFFAVNMDQHVPVDRTTLISRWRSWVVVNDFSHELGEKSQYCFAADGATHAIWSFKAPTGQGKYILLDIHLNWKNDEEQATLSYVRKNDNNQDDLLEAISPISIIVRPDLEYRSNHEVTKAFSGAELAFPKGIKALEEGFDFAPNNSAPLHVQAAGATFTQETQWHYMHHLPVEADRGLEHTTDLFSPGYFEFKLAENQHVDITASVGELNLTKPNLKDIPATAPREEVLKQSMQRFIVRRDEGQTVIAGYPWFLDWGRDTLICLRGIIAADMQQEAKDIILNFAKYEEEGTLPNMIRGNNASNRDTSDAPLWFIVAVKDYIDHFNDASVLDMDCAGRPVKEVIKSIVANYAKGTRNGIQMDESSALIYSPSHYTWMDTNYPAGTPREGYPIEIQSFWQAAVSFLSSIDKDQQWATLALKIKENILHYYP
ncbi:MAG: glycogen debranching enzyme N-terminal domain-containing protein, partial [Bacteroidales bacterium]|nr:glycogen debranching enzyme N-terminal domain-containing protein [Bacteroidales bacterium]